MAQFRPVNQFRSLDMSYIQILIPRPVAEEFVDAAGREACIQFTDLNEDVQPFQRLYTKDIIRIHELQRRIKDIEVQLKEYNIPFDSSVTSHDVLHHRRQSSVDTIQRELQKLYQEIKSQSSAEKDLKKQCAERQAKVDVLSQLDTFLSQRRALVEERLGDGPKTNNNDEVAFKYIAGVVTTAQRVSFERQVFLTTRGNSLVQFQDTQGQQTDTLVFAVFFLGNQLQRSLRRLCQFMNILICYESESEIPREVLLEQAKNERAEDKRAHSATRNLLLQIMRDAVDNLKGWKLTLMQEQGIRVTMNCFRAHQGDLFRIEGWCAANQKDRIHDILEGVVRDKGVGRAVMNESKKKNPPTYFEPNELVGVFQQIVDTYGVPRYKEFNPAIPTVISFPFLFGVMYGDIFHGSCLFLFSLSLFALPKFIDLNTSPLKSLYSVRYVLTLMGFFAIYCGLVYNDCLSIMINGWNRSQWKHGEKSEGIVLVQRDVYAFGLDPAWGGVDNHLAFANSLKMKLSVIIGVTQMTFGLFLKLSNHIQEGDYLSVWCEFVPQLTFMLCFFGYMVFLIFYKWCIDWTSSTLPDTPSLITVLIKMFLSPGNVDSEVQIFPSADGQASLQLTFLFLLILSIPIMLCVKPCILKRRLDHHAHTLLVDDHPSASLGGDIQMHETGRDEEHKTEDKERNDGDLEEEKTGHNDNEHDDNEHGSFGDIVIHQLIHTIEYVLGTISNTASYLRLWALSLAHAQLSEVFYSKTLGSTLAGTGAGAVVMNVAAAFMFLMFTFGVLLIMDVLECFLHALRLHWVEFQSKFYYGDGRPFKPFSFSKLTEKHE